MGSAMGWLHSAWDFVETCTECYRWVKCYTLCRGWSRAGKAQPCCQCLREQSRPLGLGTLHCRPCCDDVVPLSPSCCLPSCLPARPPACLPACSNGWTADEVYGQLNDEEFAQVRRPAGCYGSRCRCRAADAGRRSRDAAGHAAADDFCRIHGCVAPCVSFAQSGGVLAIHIANTPGNRNVSAAVFARWLSLVYMSLAQMGVPHPGAMEQDGWAWVSGGGSSSGSAAQAEGASASGDGGSSEGSSESTTLEAYGLADFVVHTLRNEERKEQRGGGKPGSSSGSSESSGGSGSGNASGEGAVEGVLLRKPKEALREGFVSIEDPNLLSTSPTALVMSQQISLVQVGACHRWHWAGQGTMLQPEEGRMLAPQAARVVTEQTEQAAMRCALRVPVAPLQMARQVVLQERARAAAAAA